MIRLHSLSMSRFRGVREGTIEGLTDVNLLIGRNNSGKSTVTEAITRLALRHSPTQLDLLERRLQDVWSNTRNEGGEFTPEMWYMLDTSQVVTLEARIGDRERLRNKDARISLLMRKDQNNWSVTPSTDLSGSGFAQASIGAFLSAITVFRPADATNRGIERKLWQPLITTRRDKALTNTLNAIFGLQAEGFQLLPDGRLMVLFAEHGIPLDVQGDGTRAAARALMILTMLRETMFLMEEPECHQHPGSLERFAQILCKQAREQGVQLMISTHSAECVRAFLKAAQEAGSEGAVFHLTLEDGKQEARRLDAEAVETLQSTGVDVRFLDMYA